ncbi:MAG: NeuD/PglB/VioB family sugar acetyltransferase [Marinoscillum sp.]|uniref:NeuD/PglB/VioB family sugar acetyltransferase n=1 Tax=Marinoscillum sp. TaxID=2024838 RepID=UPI0032FA4AEE
MQENDNKIYLVGYSGHSYVILESVDRLGLKVYGYLDRSRQTKNPYNLTFCGSEDEGHFIGWSEKSAFILAVGNNEIRRRIGLFIRSKSRKCLTIVDPGATISKSSTISSGTFVSAGAIINAQVEIGEDVIINTSVVVEHECKVGAGSHIAPGATILGNVEIGQNVFVGANTVIKEGIKIKDNVIVGAGSVVIDDLESNLKIVGNPAKRILR